MEFVVDNKQKFEDFRVKYPIFTYDSYSWTKKDTVLVLSFKYKFSTEDVIETSIEINLPKEVSDEILKNNEDYIFRIGLINALSYWKSYCSPSFKINCGNLSEDELYWWQDIFYDGMGEFRYRNNLLNVSKNDWVKFIFSTNKKEKNIHNFNLIGNLIAFTGGKDSSLTLGIINENTNSENEIFSINPPANFEKIRSFFNFDKYSETIINRKVHEHLLILNKEGALNGHTPFSAVVALIGVFVASLNNRKYVIVSNEGSADEVTVLGTEINHQYSKSFIFEKNFRNYCNLVWPNGPEYFSILRPFTEIGIISLLKKYEDIIPFISSCNIKKRDTLWCGKCAKCFFSFLMFSAVRDTIFAKKVLGINMFEDIENIGMLNELTGFALTKPFECVGTSEESMSAISVILSKEKNAKDEPVLKIFLEKNKDKLSDPKNFNLIACEFKTHLLPEEFLNIIKKFRKDICNE